MSWEPTTSFDSLAIKIARLGRLLEVVEDSRAKTLKEQLSVEHAHTSSWTRERNIFDIIQLQNYLQSRHNRSLQHICDHLDIWVATSTVKLKRRSESDSESSKTWGLEIMVHGYEILDSLKTLNATLFQLEYPAQSSSLRLLKQLPQTKVTPTTGTANQDEIKTQAATNNPHSPPSRPQISKSPLQAMFSACIEASQATVTHMPIPKKHVSRNIHSRLILWGTGLFSGMLDLNTILAIDRDAISGFRRHVVGIIADIASILAIILESFRVESDPQTDKALTMVEACFGKYKEFREEVADQSELLELSESCVDDFYSVSLRNVEAMIDCLFAVLPSIDRLRQTQLLDLEKSLKDKMVDLTTIIPIEITSPNTATQPESSEWTGLQDQKSAYFDSKNRQNIDNSSEPLGTSRVHSNTNHHQTAIHPTGITGTSHTSPIRSPTSYFSISARNTSLPESTSDLLKQHSSTHNPATDYASSISQTSYSTDGQFSQAGSLQFTSSTYSTTGSRLATEYFAPSELDEVLEKEQN